MEDTELNVVAVCDGGSSSASIVMRGIIKNSKHNITLRQWELKKQDIKEADIIYVHYGGMLTPWPSEINTLLEKHKDDVKWIAGIRGVLNFKRWTDGWLPTRFCDFVYDLDGISCANTKFKDIALKVDPDLNVFVCHSGTITDLFKPSPLPEEFNIGWVGAAASGAKMFGNFIRLPFPKRTAAYDVGTSMPYKELPKFYSKISVYVSVSVEEGSPVPPKEAASCGRPVLAIDCGDLAEWVPKEWIVENYKDSWRLLIPLIEQLRDDRDLLEKETVRFRQLALQWDFRTVVKEYDCMFESVMNGNVVGEQSSEIRC